MIGMRLSWWRHEARADAAMIAVVVTWSCVLSRMVLGSAIVRQTSGECQALDEQQCADTCVPLDDGRTDFECGDWFSKETCCNGTIVESFPGRDYIVCSCQSDGLTGAGIGVIVGSILAALGMAGLLAAFIVIR
uniref:Uncharacterized protein n=1 Tax=Erythrolobus australicus TaxID=1077150 RepID=A0A7S1XIY0_9RHOD|mmetsp:Transcript_4111/g.11301  ORF Transcript_4111/g.11301 Transcript_4111/m.11301 type:complete len:134 (+) Transcript_4111:119-520(+)